MKVEKCTRDSFVVIGKEGSTEEGNGFIQLENYDLKFSKFFQNHST